MHAILAACRREAHHGREDVMLETLRKHAQGFAGYTQLPWHANQGSLSAMRNGTVRANNRSHNAGVSARRWQAGIFGFASRPGDDDAAIARVLADARDHVDRYGRKTATPRDLGALPATAPGT